jgi:poly(3-hydroxybutyrate) depolymerase
VPIGEPFGKAFIEHAGYNRWADTNEIIVLYPQAVATFTNPQGCWDWWGFDDANYAVKAGRQITAVRAMLDRIASGRR